MLLVVTENHNKFIKQKTKTTLRNDIKKGCKNNHTVKPYSPNLLLEMVWAGENDEMMMHINAPLFIAPKENKKLYSKQTYEMRTEKGNIAGNFNNYEFFKIFFITKILNIFVSLFSKVNPLSTIWLWGTKLSIL